MGQDGLCGAEGDIGAPGARGQQGNPGKPGQPGDKGPAGYPGISIPGAPGNPGQPGRKGPKGPQGPAGPQGPQGKAGNPGQVGQPGPQGVEGMPGPTGNRGGLKMDSTQIEAKIRSGVRQILDQLLPASNPNKICSGQCKSYAEYAQSVYNQIIDLSAPTEAPVVKEDVDDFIPGPGSRSFGSDNDDYEEYGSEDDEVVEIDNDDDDEYNDYLDYLDGDDQRGDVVVTAKPVQGSTGQAVDLVFMIETSDYMLNLDWELVTSWVKKVITVAKADPSKNVRSAIVVIRFNESRHTMASLLERKINQMKESLQEEAVVQHIVSDTFEALEYANSQIYNNLRHGSKKVLITITDGMHRDWEEVSDANAQVLTDTIAKYPVMIAIGLGSDVDAKSLGPFASHEDKIFIDVTADRLNEITQAVLAEVEFYDEPTKK